APNSLWAEVSSRLVSPLLPRRASCISKATHPAGSAPRHGAPSGRRRASRRCLRRRGRVKAQSHAEIVALFRLAHGASRSGRDGPGLLLDRPIAPNAFLEFRERSRLPPSLWTP